VPVFALKLPDEMSSLFIADASVGSAIVVNLTHDAVRHRLAIGIATRMPCASPGARPTERASEKLVNQRLADLAVSRGQHDARIYTDDKVTLTRALGRDVSHRSALEQSSTPASEHGKQGQISRSESIGHTMAVGS
jgi:hypothetical protein